MIDDTTNDDAGPASGEAQERAAIPVAERQQAARDARIAQAQQDGAALLLAKLRAGGDPTKTEICSAILEIASGTQAHGRAIHALRDVPGEALALIVAIARYERAMDEWRRRPWFRRRGPVPEVPPMLREAIERYAPGDGAEAGP